VTEATLAALRGDQPSLARASVALRVVPGEFDLGWVGRISAAARAEPGLRAPDDIAEVKLRLARLDAGLLSAQAATGALVDGTESAALRDALSLASHLLGRLRTGWFASGLWSSEAVADLDGAEADAVEQELTHRLRSIERAALLRAGDLQPADAHRLSVLCESLRSAAYQE
jgi:hypothetical protein